MDGLRSGYFVMVLESSSLYMRYLKGILKKFFSRNLFIIEKAHGMQRSVCAGNVNIL